MATLHIKGGQKLKGNIKVNAAKNAATPILCASLLLKGKVVLKKVPRIYDVHRILDLLASIGVTYSWINDSTLELDSSKKIRVENIDKDLSSGIRSSLFLLSCLSSRAKNYKIYKSGGCKLGNRSIKPHTLALEKLGVHVRSHDCFYDVASKLKAGGDIVMYESGDTPTENAILAAVLAPGRTTIHFASANYMVQDLCHFLKKAGAKIKGIGSTTLVIDGVKKLKNDFEYSIMPDPIEAMTLLSAGITTNSTLTVVGCPIDFLRLELEKLRVMGLKFKVKNERKSASKAFTLVDITVEPSKLEALDDKIYGRPFPGFNIDNLPLFVPILTQAKGRTLVHDWVYENRAIYFVDLQKLGALVFLLDAHRVFIEGITKLQGAELMCPPAIRPAAAVLICMLAAKGNSILRNSHPLDRGYENLVERLNKIGAKIEYIPS